eukprot:SAG22_NODE_5398_length_1021_cov_2.774403_1_plen_246_part_01
MLLLLAVLLLLAAAPSSCAATAPCLLHQASKGTLVLSNGYVSASVSVAPLAAVTSLSADFSGGGAYGKSALAGPGFRLESVPSGGSPAPKLPPPPVLHIVENSSAAAWLRLVGVSDAMGAAVERWDVRLVQGSRDLELNTTSGQLRGGNGPVAAAVVHTVGFAASSITGFFAAGVVQGRGQGGTNVFLSNSSLPRLYALGEGTSVDVHRVAWGGGSGAGRWAALGSGDAAALPFGRGTDLDRGRGL